MGADPDLTPVGLARMSGCAEHQAGRNCPVHGTRKLPERWTIHICPECKAAVERLRRFAEWVAGYESERQLVGSGVIDRAKEALGDA